MNKKIWILLVVTYLTVLMIDAPASILSRFIFQISKGQIELANTQGTVWRGAANPVFHQRNGSLVVLQQIRWEIATLTLLTGKVSANFFWQEMPQKQPMTISFSAKKLELQNIYIPLPAMLLTNISDFLKPAQLRGQLIFKSDSLSWTPTGWQGAATADWLNASSLISQIAPLGDYHLNFSATSSGVSFDLSTVAGALLLNGSGNFSTSGNFNFKATAKAEIGKEAALNELLNHLGPEQGDGVHTFNLLQ